MIYPVTLESGITFDRDEIEKWFLNKDTCPVTRQSVNKQIMIPNHIIHNITNVLVEKFGDRKGSDWKKIVDLCSNYNSNKMTTINR